MSQDKGKTKNIEKNEKIKWVVPLSILSLSFILLGGFLPVFFNFSKLTCILKVVFIAFYSIGLALVVALAYFDKNNKEEERCRWKDKVFSTFLYIVYTLSFLMFFDHELWGYKDTVYGLLFLVVLFLEIYISIKIILGKKLNLEKTSTVLILKCTPNVRHCDIMFKRRGDFLCQKEYRTRDIQENSNKK